VSNVRKKITLTVQTHGHGMTFVNVSYAKEYGIGKRKTFSFQTHTSVLCYVA
jgi:hypothetical protein